MYEDCIEKFNCNRYPNGCSVYCYRALGQHESNANPDCYQVKTCCPETVTVFPQDRVYEGLPGRDGKDGAPLEFKWEYTNTSIRLGVRVKGTDNWYFSPSLIGPKGPKGEDGREGKPGLTPYVGPGNTWWIGAHNTEVDVSSGYVLRPATEEMLGGVKIGTGLEVTEDGIISAQKLEVDSEVIEGSENPISGDGVKKYVDEIMEESIKVLQEDVAEINTVIEEKVATLPVKGLEASEENIIDINTLQEPGIYFINNAREDVTVLNSPLTNDPTTYTVVVQITKVNSTLYQTFSVESNTYAKCYLRYLFENKEDWETWNSCTVPANTIAAGTLTTGMKCATPTENEHLANKNYVDTQIATRAASTHNQSASTISAGTLAGAVVANASAVASLNSKQVRNVYFGTGDLTAGSSSLTTGDIYFVYE